RVVESVRMFCGSGRWWLCRQAPPSRPLNLLSLHDALPISMVAVLVRSLAAWPPLAAAAAGGGAYVLVLAALTGAPPFRRMWVKRSEEHTSELQSLRHLVCRVVLEKKNSTSRRACGSSPRPR